MYKKWLLKPYKLYRKFSFHCICDWLMGKIALRTMRLSLWQDYTWEIERCHSPALILRSQLHKETRPSCFVTHLISFILWYQIFPGGLSQPQSQDYWFFFTRYVYFKSEVWKKKRAQSRSLVAWSFFHLDKSFFVCEKQ